MVPVTYARIELSAGGVIYRQGAAGPEVLLIKDSYGNWGFPKGHVETEETHEEAALRESREEAGLLRLRLVGSLGMTDWYFRAQGNLVHKYCDYFLVEADPTEQAEPQVDEGIGACRWLQPEVALERVTYDNARQVLLAVWRFDARLFGPLIARGDDGGRRGRIE
ncbi:MAG: NUDIX domain-containing protein [Gemmatimonadota bacterium]|nr:MAG: NUDIX domain-containing protein [Gemmatimonadota bacterium]